MADTASIQTLPVSDVALLLVQVSSCKTWTGRGDAASGEVQAASDLDFVIDTDSVTGAETVTVTENKQARRQGVHFRKPSRGVHADDSSICIWCIPREFHL